MILRQYQIEAINALMEYWRKTPQGVPLIVAPTGSGKSAILSEISRLVLKKRPDFKIWVVTHRKELIQQNSRELISLLNIPIGVYSAGLKSKTVRSVTSAGIQSIYKKDVEADLVIVDECHLISSNDDSMYKKFLNRIWAKNPNAKFCGLTATPYRLDQGSLVGDFFTDIVFDIEVRRLIEEKFLSTLISKPRGEIDFSNVERSGFDYKQSALEQKMSPFIKEHCDEILKLAFDRKSILIFCSGVKHAKDIAWQLSISGEKADYISGDMLGMQRDQVINKFKSGELRILCNCEILTTGFNHPPVDCIALLRATKSTGLYVQMVGRGMRNAEGKKNCLVLDFGGNIERHGPIDCVEVKIDNRDKSVSVGKLPVKTCPACGAVWPIKVLECSCGYAFSRQSTVELKPTKAAIISEVETLDVTSMHKKIHRKEGSPPMVRIDYVCGIRTISDFFCFEHGGYPARKAYEKWFKIGGTPPLNSTEALLQPIKTPASIRVIKDGKFYRVLEHLGEKKVEDEFEWEFKNPP